MEVPLGWAICASEIKQNQSLTMKVSTSLCHMQIYRGEGVWSEDAFQMGANFFYLCTV